jgi:DNA-binding MarR family transcriptional regulator
VQLLDNETIKVTSSECSAQLIELVPLIMRSISGEMRRRTLPGLSVPQYRTLNFLQRHPGASLSDVAVFLGLTLPSTSKIVQKFVTQKVVSRKTAGDRRRICLSLTQQGTAALTKARLETHQKMMEKLGSLTAEELATVSASLRVLNSAFSERITGVSISQTL